MLIMVYSKVIQFYIYILFHHKLLQDVENSPYAIQ